MKSAYATLGIALDAGAEEIEEAFERAGARYTPQRLAMEPGAAERWAEIKAAYEALQSPQLRAAHERRAQMQAAQQQPLRVVTVIEEGAPARRIMQLVLLLLAGLAIAASVVGYKNAEARREQAALAIEIKKQQEKASEAERAEAARAAAEAAAAKAHAEAEERRLTEEGRLAGERATRERQRQEAAANAERQRMEAERQRLQYMQSMEESQRAAEARRRVEADKLRIRQMCIQLYGRPDC